MGGTRKSTVWLVTECKNWWYQPPRHRPPSLGFEMAVRHDNEQDHRLCDKHRRLNSRNSQSFLRSECCRKHKHNVPLRWAELPNN